MLQVVELTTIEAVDALYYRLIISCDALHCSCCILDGECLGSCRISEVIGVAGDVSTVGLE